MIEIKKPTITVELEYFGEIHIQDGCNTKEKEHIIPETSIKWFNMSYKICSQCREFIRNKELQIK